MYMYVDDLYQLRTHEIKSFHHGYLQNASFLTHHFRHSLSVNINYKMQSINTSYSRIIKSV